MASNGVPYWLFEKLENKVYDLERKVRQLTEYTSLAPKAGAKIMTEDGVCTVTALGIGFVWAKQPSWPHSKEYKHGEYTILSESE